MTRLLLSSLIALGLAAGAPAMAQSIPYGDDSSPYANDGECDDKRFEGPGMTATILLDSDVGRDATDCRQAVERGQLLFNGALVATVNFGDDTSPYANDGECDDKRFRGPGMTSPLLLDSDIGHDATDCRQAYERGDLKLVSQ